MTGDHAASRPGTGTENPYLDQVHRNLPRLLANFDRDRTSQTYGVGDRFHWAWKLIDFPNGTFQAAAGGLSRLVDAQLLPDWLSEEAALRRIDAMFTGARAITAPDGSLCEAFPREASFCVSAMVAAELLTAIELLGDRISPASRKDYLRTVEPMCDFLHRQDEHHGIISNHLATAVQALVLWEDVGGGGGIDRAHVFLDRILAHQSAEGWFREYDGADPGYQSWLTSALADVHGRRPDLGLAEPLARSIRFLWHFAHPDGSFGGVYGSRSTRFCFPAGLEFLASESTEARALCTWLRPATAEHRLVTLDVADDPNLVPFFNDYCGAATSVSRSRAAADSPPALPANGPPFRRHFPEAGILVDRGAGHYTVIGTGKGGAFLHLPDGADRIEDPGYVAQDSQDNIVTGQAGGGESEVSIDGDRIEIVTPLRRLHRPYPRAFDFVILRLLSLTAFRSLWLGNLVKRLLARYLVTGKPRPVGRVRRSIALGRDMHVEDVATDGPMLTPLPDKSGFSAIHMASQGYWQKSDDAP